MSPLPGYALITGASSGIGTELARAYAQRGVPLVLTARREARLQALAEELLGLVPVEIIALDLAEADAPAALVQEIERRGLSIRILVNNAGYGVPGRYHRQDWQTHARFLQVMLVAVAELTWRLLPGIRDSGQGRILNISSFAALAPGADGQTLYAPVKSFMLPFSESLALENADRGVKVTTVCPGFTWSEFHDITGTRESMSRLPSWAWLRADAVARAAIEGNERGQVRVVPGTFYKLLQALIACVPAPLLRRLMAGNSHRLRPVD